MSALGATIFKGTLWIFGGRIARRVLGFFVAIIMARLLLPEDFGLVVTMSVFTGVAGYFAAGGMGNALVRAKSITEDDYSTVFVAQLAICSAIYCGFYYISPYFAGWFDEHRYEFLLQVSALTFLIRPFNNVASSKIQRHMRFRALSMIKIFTTVMSSACGLLLAYYGYGPWSLILSGLFGAMVSMPVMMVTAGWYPRLKINPKTLKSFSTQGIKFSANDIADYLRIQLPNLVISSYIGPAATGLYNRAHSLSSMPIELLGGSSYQALFRGLAKAENDQQAAEIFLKALAMISLYTMPIFVGLWWIVEPFILVVYGEKWLGSVPPLQVLAFIGLLPIGAPCGAMIAARGSLGKEFKTKLETLLCLLFGSAIAINYGPTGIALLVVLTRLYLNLRVFSIAKLAAPVTWRDLVIALSPGFSVSVLLLGVLTIIELVGVYSLRVTSPWLYLITISLSGFAFTCLLAQFIPLKVVSAEILRWKKLLRLPG